MMENAWYTTITPEACSTILWKDQEKAAARKTDCAEALRLTAADLLELGVIDRIIEEPMGGAHHDHDAAKDALKAAIKVTFDDLTGIPVGQLLAERLEKFSSMGAFDELADEVEV